MKRLILVMALFVGITTISHAQNNQQPLSLNLDTIIQLATTQNLSVLSASEEQTIAKGRITEAWADALPSLNSSADWQYHHTDDSGGDEASSGLSLNQPLYRGGSIPAGIRAAKLYGRYAAQTQDTTLLNTIRNACVYYYNVLLARENVRVAEESVKLSRYNLEQAQGKRKLGTAINLDVTRAKEQLSSDQAEIIKARNDLDITTMRLLNLLRLPVDNLIEVKGEFEYQPETTTLNEAVQTALDRRPDLAQLRVQVELQQENIKIVKASRLPQLDLTSSFTRSYTAHGAGEGYDNNWFTGITFSYPIFEGNRTKALVTQEEAKLNQYNNNVQQQIDNILLEVSESVRNLSTSERIVEARQINVEQARENLDLARKGYAHGVNIQLDVLDAQLNFTESQLQYAQAIYDHNIYRIDMEYAQGILFDRIDPSISTSNQTVKE